mmetsp:Transcript_39475/g.50927  ORF Transcript_39475/g.50927 Transcript_39475/m.50927 type:complete len:319 (+) Transcript_39475:274-1230(+)
MNLFIESYGISSISSIGSGRGVWDGSIIFGCWLCSCILKEEIIISQSSSSSSLSGSKKRRVLELGAGCSGVPGLALALNFPEQLSIVLTDHHHMLVKALDYNIQLNNNLCPSSSSSTSQSSSSSSTSLENQSHRITVTSQILNWNDYDSPDFTIHWKDEEGNQNNNNENNNENSDEDEDENMRKADVIIGSELLWSGCDPIPLIKTISKLLNPINGICYILMPKGGRGIEKQFLESLLMEGFKYETILLSPRNKKDGEVTTISTSSSASSSSASSASLDQTLQIESQIVRPLLNEIPKDILPEDEIFQVHIITFAVKK